VLASCAPFGTSKLERVDLFEADLNGNREYLYQNFLEAETIDYVSIRDDDIGTTWDYWFPPGVPEPGTYSIALDSIFGNPLEGTVDGPDDFSGPKSIQFYLTRAGIYWYLEKVVLNGSQIVD
jgi:hypothetical protein